MWCVSRSSSAPVSRSDRNTDGHSSKGGFDVTMAEPRSLIGPHRAVRVGVNRPGFAGG